MMLTNTKREKTMPQTYVCPLGCVIQVTNKQDIDAHNGKHTDGIETLLYYYLDIVAPGKAKLYRKILVMFEEHRLKVPDPLPKNFQQPSMLTANFNTGQMEYS